MLDFATMFGNGPEVEELCVDHERNFSEDLRSMSISDHTDVFHQCGTCIICHSL